MPKPAHTVHLKNLGTPRQTHVASATTPQAKEAARDKIQRQVDEFLAKGGSVQRPDLEDRTQKVRRRFNAFINDTAIT